MKNQRRSWLSLGLLGFVLTCISIVQSNAQTPLKQYGEVRAFNELRFQNDEGKDVTVNSLATLFKDGQPVRSKEMSNNFNDNSAIWNKVPVGAYELQFEVVGYGKVIKRVVVAADETTDVKLSSVSKNDQLWGIGPTLFDLQRKIALLEKQNADLQARQARLAALEKAK